MVTKLPAERLPNHSVVIKEFSDLTLEERSQLATLTNDPQDSLFHSWLHESDQAGKYAAVVRDNNAIIGWAAVARAQDLKTIYYELGVFVAPDYRNQGIGCKSVAALMEHFLQIERCPKIWNEGPRGFYERALSPFVGRFNVQQMKVIRSAGLY